MGDYSCQTSVRHSEFLKYIIEAAKPHLPTPRGMGTSKNDFFVISAGAVAKKILMDIGIYDNILKQFEANFGPTIEDFNLGLIGGIDGEQGNIDDPLLDELEDPILEKVESMLEEE